MQAITSTLLISMVAPAVLAMFGLGFAWLWHTDRRRGHLLLAALACLAFAAGVCIQILQLPPGHGPNAIASAIAYSAAVLLACDALMARSGRRLGKSFNLAVLIVITGLIAWFSYVTPDLLVRVYVLNFGFGAVFLVTAFQLRALAHGKASDRLLFWTLLVFGLHFFPRTILSAVIGMPEDAASFGKTFFWTALQVSLVVFGVALALAIVVAAASDSIDEARMDRDLDGLTQLVNRRGFFETSASRLHSGTAPLSLVIGDIDHFKAINDTYGHGAGDAVLRVVGEVLRHDLRSGDVAARLGGEEFAILLPNTNRNAAFVLVERLRHRLEQTHHTALPTTTKVTASFGIAQHRRGENLDQLLDRADRLLYAAKAAGRNRTVVEPPDLRIVPPADLASTAK